MSYSYGYKAQNNPSMPYTGPSIGAQDTAYMTGPSSHDPKPWEQFFGQIALPDQTPIGKQRSRESYNLPDAFQTQSSYMQQVMITNISETTWWEFDILPMTKKDDTVEVNLDRWIFDNHLAGRTPSEAPTRMVTSRWEQSREYMLRHGLSMIFDHDFWKTKKGQDQYALNVQQVQNAVVTTAAMGVIYACLKTDPYKDIWRRRNGGVMDRVAFERTLRDEIATTAMFQKTENGLELAQNRAKMILRERNQNNGNFTVLPAGSLIYNEFARPERKYHYLNGGSGNPTSDNQGEVFIRDRDGGRLVESRSYTGDSTEPTHDPFFRRRAYAGFFHLGRHNIKGANVKYDTHKLNIDIYSEDHDDYVTIDYGRNLLTKCGLWCEKKITQMGAEFFDAKRNHHERLMADLHETNNFNADSDDEFDMSDSDDENDNPGSGIMNAFDWMELTHRGEEAITKLVDMTADTYKKVYNRIKSQNSGKKRRGRGFEDPAKRMRIESKSVPIVPLTTADSHLLDIRHAETDSKTTVTATDIEYFDPVSGEFRSIASADMEVSPGHITIANTSGNGTFMNAVGTIAYRLMNGISDGDADDAIRGADDYKHLKSLLLDLESDASGFDSTIFSKTAGVQYRAGRRIVIPYVTKAIRMILAANAAGGNTKAALKTAMEKFESTFSAGTDAIVYDAAVSNVTTNMRKLATNRRLNSDEKRTGLGPQLFPVYSDAAIAADFASYQYIDFISILEASHPDDAKVLKNKLRTALQANKSTKKIFQQWASQMKKKLADEINKVDPQAARALADFLSVSGEADSLYALAAFQSVIGTNDGTAALQLIDEYNTNPLLFRKTNFGYLDPKAKVPINMYPPNQLLGQLITQLINGIKPLTTNVSGNAFEEDNKATNAAAMAVVADTGGDPSSVAQTWLRSMSMGDYSFVQFCLQVGIDPCIKIIGWRNHKTYECGSMLRCRAGGAAGNTFHGHSDFMLQKQASQKKVYGNYTIWMKAIIKRPENITQVRDVVIRNYYGGNGNKIIDPCNGNHIASIQQGDHSVGDIFLTAVPATWEPSSWYCDITGQFHSSLMEATASEGLLYPTADLYSKIWGWRNVQKTDTLNVGYWGGSRSPVRQNYSTVAIQGYQRIWDGHEIQEQGHLGHPYPGLAGVHRGEIKTQLTKDGIPGFRINDNNTRMIGK
jgi:hypothetical protein